MKVSAKSMKGVAKLSAYEIIQTIISFGTFTVALLTLVLNTKNKK